MVEIFDGDYKAYITNENIIIQHNQYNKVLNINKNTSKIFESDLSILNQIKKTTINSFKPHAILGIISIEDIEILILVKSAFFIGKIEEAEIFRINEVELIPIVPNYKIDNISNEIKNISDGIKKLYTLGFFYSFNYDLTNSIQNQSKMKGIDILTSANKKYFWNFCLYKKFYLTNYDMNFNSNNYDNDNDNDYDDNNNKFNKNGNEKINRKGNENKNENENENENGKSNEAYNSNEINSIPKVNKIWMIVCIYGYFGTINSQINTNKIEVHLISRRSIFHSGTRYLTRGIDDNGHVANHLETEQIVKFNQNLFSFLQLRGSVPIFFEQPGISAQTIITRNSDMTAPAFKKHIDEIKEDFNYIYLVNLMNVNKPNEQIITQNYETQIKNIEVNNCKYLYWDFQNQCKFDNYENLDNFVDNLESVFKIFKYYHENNKGEILKKQNGIIRTNCLDCLDRTNVIQARIAWKSLQRHVKYII
jgi:hypothetical protein